MKYLLFVEEVPIYFCVYFFFMFLLHRPKLLFNINSHTVVHFIIVRILKLHYMEIQIKNADGFVVASNVIVGLLKIRSD